MNKLYVEETTNKDKSDRNTLPYTDNAPRIRLQMDLAENVKPGSAAEPSVSLKKPKHSDVVVHGNMNAMKDLKDQTEDYNKKVAVKSMKKAWEKYKLMKNREDDDEEDTLPENYPNSNYQKIWEQSEYQDEEADKPKRRRGRTKLPEEKEQEEATHKHLADVMSLTPQENPVNREDVSKLANSVRQVTERAPQRVKTPGHLEEEDSKIKDQLNILWEDTDTKPMTKRPVNKNIIRMYGEPAEELPETVSPPPVLYKTIDVIKKKTKGKI